MTVTIHTEDDPDVVGDQKISLKLRDWLSHCEKTLDFIFENQVPELSVEEALQGPPQAKICDTIGNLEDPHIKKKLVSVEDLVTGREVDQGERLKSRNLVVRLNTGEEASGRWVKGRRVGQGSLVGDRLEKVGVRMVSGQYEDGILTGLGKVIMMDSMVMQGWFQHGYLHGPARATGGDSSVTWLGHYRSGLAWGTCWKSVLGGGWLVGRVDSSGTFTGQDIAFLYPDLSTALVGEWRDGTLVSGFQARLTGLEIVQGVMVPKFTVTDTREYRHWVSTSEAIQCPPHIPDPYESHTVVVGPSSLPGAGEGLYAARDITPGQLVAYYNGIRMKKEQQSPFENSGYAIFVEWEDRGSKAGEHMDLPPELHSSADYSSTLAHKLNHSFGANCEWSNALHPCYGLVPSVTALVDIHQGEELTVNYALNMEYAPVWYQHCWELYTQTDQ